MLTLAALVASALTAAPTYSVVVTRRVGLDAKVALELSDAFAGCFDADGSKPLGKLVSPRALMPQLLAAGFADPGECGGSVECAAKLGRAAGLDRLVAVQLVKIGTSLALDASLVDVREGKAVGAVTGMVRLGKYKADMPPLAAELASRAPPWVEPEPPAPAVAAVEPPPDAPVREPEPELKPPPPEPRVEAPAPPPEKKGRYLAYGLQGAALVSAGVGVAFGVSASSRADRLSSRDPDYPLHRDQVMATARTADAFYAGAVALTVGAAVTWWLTREEGPAP